MCELMERDSMDEGFKKGLAAGLLGAAALSPAFLTKSLDYQQRPKDIPAKYALTEPPKEAPKEPPNRDPRFPAKVANEPEYFGKYIAKNEGIETKIYDDGRGNPTIGIGHMIKPNSRAMFNRLFPEIDFDRMVAGKQSITKDQAMILFMHDLREHLERARSKFPKFDQYPTYLKAALLDTVYRGDTGPKTLTLINNDKWEEAAKEYLNRHDYKNRFRLGIRGIGPRMDRNKDAMLYYGQQFKGTE